MNQTIRIGTRKSELALAQTDYIIECIKEIDPSICIEKVLMSTKGDKILNQSLQSFGGKGAFITEFEEAMLKGDIDIAVHSAKDMPMELKSGLAILAHSKREDPRDVLVTLKDRDWKEVLEKGVIGTCSLRRQLMVEMNYKSTVKGLRGNVQTRLAKLDGKEYDGIILAAAGLKRLNLINSDKYQIHYFSEEECIPAGGQGIIAVEGRNEKELISILNNINNKESEYCLETEREVLHLLDAGCSEPIGVYSNISPNSELSLSIIYEDEGHIYKENGVVALECRLQLAKELTDKIKEKQIENRSK